MFITVFDAVLLLSGIFNKCTFHPTQVNTTDFKAAFTMTHVPFMGIRVRVRINMNLHVFQWQPFTLIQVHYKFDFHSHGLLLQCTGLVSRQPV